MKGLFDELLGLRRHSLRNPFRDERSPQESTATAERDTRIRD